MRNYFRKVMLLSLSFIALTVDAHQRIPLQTGVSVNAFISTRALNRIAVEEDRIVSVKGETGQFELDNDVELGEVFIKPVNESDKPIPLFISTEKGNTYALSLNPKDIAAENIVLVPEATFEKSNAYEAALQAIVKAMHTQTALEGFAIDNAKIKLPNVLGAKVTHLQSYASHQLLGQILEVYNAGEDEILLTEESFSGEGVRAVSIVNPILLAHDKTRVYVVRK